MVIDGKVPEVETIEVELNKVMLFFMAEIYESCV